MSVTLQLRAFNKTDVREQHTDNTSLYSPRSSCCLELASLTVDSFAGRDKGRCPFDVLSDHSFIRLLVAASNHFGGLRHLSMPKYRYSSLDIVSALRRGFFRTYLSLSSSRCIESTPPIMDGADADNPGLRDDSGHQSPHKLYITRANNLPSTATTDSSQPSKEVIDISSDDEKTSTAAAIQSRPKKIPQSRIKKLAEHNESKPTDNASTPDSEPATTYLPYPYPETLPFGYPRLARPTNPITYTIPAHISRHLIALNTLNPHVRAEQLIARPNNLKDFTDARRTLWSLTRGSVKRRRRSAQEWEEEVLDERPATVGQVWKATRRDRGVPRGDKRAVMTEEEWFREDASWLRGLKRYGHSLGIEEGRLKG